jgi:PAS domain S-box-containing protein
MSIDPSAEILRLRATVRDLLALSTIPEAWVGREPQAVATDLADLLIGSLGLDFAFVRLRDPTGCQVVEVTRGNSWKAFPEWLQEHLSVFGQISRKEIVTNVGGVEESCCGIVIPIGVNSERGLVAAASDRPEFPDQIEQQLLSVAANNAATPFQNASLINELRRAQEALRANEQELRKARDELEIKVAERTAELRRSERYLAEAQRLSHTGSFGWYVSSGETFWSDETFRIFQCDPRMKPTVNFVLSRVHREDHDLVQHEIDRASRDGESFDFEYRLQVPDGSVKHVRVTAHPSRDTAGNLEFVGAVTDVSEHRQAEAMIRERERELQQILDLAPQHIGVFAPDGSPLYANRTTLEYLGVEIDRWRDETARYGYVHPDDRERFLGERKRRFLEGVPHEFEVRLLGHDGRLRWFLFRLNPLKDERGQITRWHGTGIDIEERKQAEDRLRRENVALREEIDKTSMFEEIVGASPALQAVLARISKVARSDSTVLITGETGTGKELVARAIHRRSDRSSRAFVSVNCAAIPRDLIASELFGHEKGAFTGATQQRLGRFELANGGTLFLDEVGDLPAETQIALLRVLQEHEFERVGGTRRIHADVRVIAATNRDLLAAISAGSFRSDLFYRLNVFPIETPSLRERRVDIPLLVEYFIDRYARKVGKRIRGVSKKTLELLQSYPWPGNIRELQNVIERSVIVCETENFSVDESWLSQQPSNGKTESQLCLSDKVAAQEKDTIEAALRESQGRVFGPSGAAAKLGIARSTLESKIRSLKIDKNRFRTSSKVV